MQVNIYRRDVDGKWPKEAFKGPIDQRSLALVFGASETIEKPEAVLEVVERYGAERCVGCSTAGEIFGTEISDHTVVFAAIQFAGTRVRTASLAIGSPRESRAAGQALAHKLLEPDLRSVLVFSDGLSVNGTDLVGGINSVLPASVVVTGGLAGDGDRFQKTWVLADGAPRQGMLSAVGLYGDRVVVSHGSKGGWDIFGPERRVTRSDGNILYELDGKNALALYKNYLGERASDLPASGLLFPLSIRSGPEDQTPVVRTILEVSEANQSLTFAGDIPQGFYAQLMRANFDRLVQGASDAASQCLQAPKDGATLAIAISCVGRRLVLGERCEEEVEATADILGASARQVGFYSYGELSPYATGRCDLHNQTMTLTTIAEN